MEVLTWIKTLTDVLSKLAGILKETPEARRRKLAQRLSRVHGIIADVVLQREMVRPYN